MTPREALYHISMSLGPIPHTMRDDNLSPNEAKIRDAVTTLQTWVDADVLPRGDLFEVAEPASPEESEWEWQYRNTYNPSSHVEEHTMRSEGRAYNSIEPLTPVQVSRLELDDLDRYLHSADGFLPTDVFLPSEAAVSHKTTPADSIHPITDALPMYGLIENIIEWHYDRNLIHGSTDKDQFCKLIQECGELSDNLCKGNDIKDDIGDIMVVLLNIAERNNVCLAECLNVAYDDIKDRKGLMVDGVFIKYD